MNNDIIVYSTRTWSNWAMMKEFLEAQGLPYKEVNVQEDVDAQKLAQETGQMGMIKVNDQWVLDFDTEKLKKYLH